MDPMGLFLNLGRNGLFCFNMFFFTRCDSTLYHDLGIFVGIFGVWDRKLKCQDEVIPFRTRWDPTIVMQRVISPINAP